MKNHVLTAGGIIFRGAGVEKQILLIRNEHGLFFPKGHVEEGETIEEAAVREVQEETGFREVRIIKKLGVVSRYGPRDQKMKDIHLFLMEIFGSQRGQAEENWDWYKMGEAIKKMAFKEEGEFLENLKI